MAVKVTNPKGTRDFLPLAVARRQYVIDIIRRVYEARGFAPLETPTYEKIETLTGKYGEEGDQLIFKILKRGAKAASGECDLGLRYDLTVPLARLVAQYQNDLPRIFKRYQIQPVWRADRPARGLFREFYQCDIDIVGGRETLCEIELLGAAAEVLDALGFSDAVLRINDRRVLRGLIEVCGVDPSQETTAIVAIDKLDKIGLDGVRKELGQREIPGAAADALIVQLKALATLTDSDSVLTELSAQFEGRDDALAGLEGLRQILSGLSTLGLSEPRVCIDPMLARGLSYYTGPIFEVAVPELAGSLAGGGRYDGLIGMFMGRDVPAVGISLGFERILVVMEERGLFPELGSSPDVLVADFGPQTRSAALLAASALRADGLRVDLYPQSDKLGKQFKYADARGIGFVVVIGPDEAQAAQVRIKNMASGEQSSLAATQVAEWIATQRSATQQSAT